ncbi:MATE family efflux transporter [Butyrivibrio sp. VCD2006]|uniref:MATE family efflux transporter n=1 Tax=Butyrivibrio sp. VCD2006 TaxID=1280664 RepID=UPI0004002CAC|nr:MATE family efflux transporter [Butyrivibrio sp. VCD2006]
MKTNNMTEGNSLKQIVLFFLPLLMGNLFQQVYSLVDSIIVGKGIGDKALAAVGASGTLNFLILGFVVGLTRGFGINFSQSFGKGDSKLLRSYILAAQYISLAISVLFTLLCLLALREMLTFLQTPSDIYSDAYAYFAVILAGITITVLNNLTITILQSLGDSKTPLTAMVISSIINIILDLLFVMGLHLGVIGAAIATVIAQAVSYIYCRFILSRIPDLSDEKSERIKRFVMPELTLCVDLLKMGLPVAFMNSVTAAGGMILQYFVNLMGSAYVAAYSVCMKFAGLFEQFGISVGLAILTFVGQNKGAGKYDRIRKGVRQGLVLSVIVNIPLALIQIVFPEKISGLMLSDPDTIGYCAQFMPILGISLFALGWLFVFRYAVQGLGNTIVPMFSGFLEVALRLVFGFTLGKMSFTGIAISEVSAWIGAAIMLALTYLLSIFVFIPKSSHT